MDGSASATARWRAARRCALLPARDQEPHSDAVPLPRQRPLVPSQLATESGVFRHNPGHRACATTSGNNDSRAAQRHCSRVITGDNIAPLFAEPSQSSAITSGEKLVSIVRQTTAKGHDHLILQHNASSRTSPMRRVSCCTVIAPRYWPVIGTAASDWMLEGEVLKRTRLIKCTLHCDELA